MKITLLNRNEADHVGGDMIQLREYEKVLRALGHDVDYYWALNPKIEGQDEWWMFHCQFGWNYHQYQVVRASGIPYRVFAIFYPGVYSDIQWPETHEILEGAKAIYCLSEEEKQEMIAEQKLSPEAISRIHIIPNGVDKKVFNDKGFDRRYVMTAGRYDQTKGHLLVAEIAKELNLPFLTVGPVWTQSEIDGCRKLEGRDDEVLGPVDQEELNDLYNQAKVYVCASGSERNNLCILEAAATGAAVINSTRNRGNKWLSAPVVDSRNRDELKAAILEAYNDPKIYEDEIVSWEEVINQILNK
jgi:glycosyltransferase involved in cell wall biosynthesis